MTAEWDTNHFEITVSSNTSYLRICDRIRKTSSALAFSMVCIIYAGYIFQIEKLYRVIPKGSATHELTALCIGLLAMAIFYEKLIHKSKISLTLAGIATAISTLRAIEFLMQGNFISDLTPFHEIADQAVKQGFSHSMGINTTIAVFSLSLSMLLRHTRPVGAFVIGSIAPFILISSMVGYTYRAAGLHGAMSLNTTLVFCPLCAAFLMLWVHHPFVRGLFAKSLIGHTARIELLLAVILPWLGGLLLMRMEGNITILTFALYSTMLSWVAIGLILLNVIQLERKDRKRRCYERKLLELSTTDQLTGCYNRRMAVEFGQLAMTQTMRSGRAISLLMMDIDDFKCINDTYGHPKGDDVIQSIAHIAKRNLRGADIIARWGGEEFVVLLYDSGSDGAYQVAEKIRSDVENMNQQASWHSLPKATVSIGYTTYESGSDSFYNLVKCADDAMYFAKQNGKNRVIQYTEKMKAFSIV